MINKAPFHHLLMFETKMKIAWEKYQNQNEADIDRCGADKQIYAMHGSSEQSWKISVLIDYETNTNHHKFVFSPSLDKNKKCMGEKY